MMHLLKLCSFAAETRGASYLRQEMQICMADNDRDSFPPIRIEQCMDWQPGLWPIWTQKPDCADIEDVVRQELGLEEQETCRVVPLASGTLNELFVVTTSRDTTQYVFKASLPVCPEHKTKSEVATMRYIRAHTDLPVSKVIAHSIETTTLGYEWILMTSMPGDDLGAVGYEISMDAKRKLVRDLAGYLAKLVNLRFAGIGGLVASDDSGSGSVVEGPCCAYDFFLLDQASSTISKGPFNSSAEWLTARLDMFIHDQERIVARGGTRDSIEGYQQIWMQEDFFSHSHGTEEEARYRRSVAQRLKLLTAKTFTSEERLPEATCLYHHDLHNGNLMVDDAGKLSAILDWECITTVPLWEACQLPAFLRYRWRETSADRRGYPPHHPRVRSGDAVGCAPNAPETNDLVIWESLAAKEQDELTTSFLGAMQTVCPQWIQVRDRSKLKANLGLAVSVIGNPWHTSTIEQWCNAVERGEFEHDLEEWIYRFDETRLPSTGPPSEEALTVAELKWATWRLSSEISRVEWPVAGAEQSLSSG